jgi:glycosyltransferase involved in cell wall biosynthesis
MRAATVLALPSTLESFGIVALEAMAASTPVLVDAGGDAAVEHCRRGNAGLFYRDYADFREALSLLMDDAKLRESLGRNGSAYVHANYSWGRVVERYEAFLSAL